MKTLKKNLVFDIGNYCRHYRMFIADLTLREVAGDNNVKNLSAFEHGRSSNFLHLIEYMRLADERFELDEFVGGLMEIVNSNCSEILGGD